MKLGMGNGPALSLPSMVVICKVVGFRKTLAFCLLTVVMSTIVGWFFGMFFGSP